MSLSPNQIEEFNQLFGLTSEASVAHTAAGLPADSAEELNKLFGITAADVTAAAHVELAEIAPSLEVEPTVLQELLETEDPTSDGTNLRKGALSDEMYLADVADYPTPPVEVDRGIEMLLDLSKLEGKTVVLTGKPPRNMTKAQVAQHLKRVFGVKAVDDTFTARTQVLIYSRLQTETAKLKKALQAKLVIVPYDNVLDW